MPKLFRQIYNKIVIPKGDYCYKLKEVIYPEDGSKPILKTKRCPYWCWDERFPNDEVGYCKLLQIGDRDGNSGGLLFDQVKECGVNNYD